MNANLCSLDDSVPIDKNKRDCNVTTPPFGCVRRSCRTFLRFATVPLFFLTLQALRKYAEKKLRVVVGPNSPCRHATITAKNTVFVPQSLPSRRQPGLRGHFFSQLPSPRLRAKKQASDETRFSCDINTAWRTIPPTKRELHYPFRTTRRLFEPSRLENRSR